MILAVLLIIVFAAPLAVLAAGRLHAAAAGPVAVAGAAAAFVAAAVAWGGGAGDVVLPWIGVWHIRLRFAVDGLGALYALLATGIGTVVLLYALRYMPAHAAKSGMTPQELTRFFALMSLFTGAMVGLAVARELYALTIFWDLTAVASFLLIGTGAPKPQARRAAQLALIVTAGSAVLLLVAVVLLHAAAGTTDVATLRATLPAGAVAEWSAALIAIAALAKSAQAPFHFWLPRAMVAPTPVSAYLHSAAMVAGGVFLLSLLHPLIAATRIGPVLLIAAGAASILVGSVLALRATDLKAILAYSTVAQYGYVVVMLGVGGAAAATGAAYYVLAHAVAKSGLFMTAGAVTEATGEHALDRAGGLLRPMRAWAAAAGVCAATLAGLPLTIGYFKDELFFGAAHDAGLAMSIFAAAAAALTLAYTWRFWGGVFLGAPREPVRHVLPARPVVLLAAAALAGGVFNAPFARIADAAALVIAPEADPAPHTPSARADAEGAMAASAYVIGAALVLARRRTDQPWRAVARAGEWIGPARVYRRLGRLTAGVSTWLHDRETRDMRGRVASVLLPGGLIVAAAVPAVWRSGVLHAGAFRGGDAPLMAALLLAGVAAVGATVPSRHLTLLLASSLVTYSMAAAFALLGAPDVALVTVVVQIAIGLLMLGILSVFPRPLLHAAARLPSRPRRRAAVSIAAGAGAFIVAWVALSTSAPPGAGASYVRLAPDAHASDAVTAVLADFRGLDTLGEATVLAIALLGLATLLIARWREP
jgi:multicomponent Na+:H+ antiporter subunit A